MVHFASIRLNLTNVMKILLDGCFTLLTVVSDLNGVEHVDQFSNLFISYFIRSTDLIPCLTIIYICAGYT